MVLSLWAMTILSLYIRVQVNILGRHLYIDTARHLGTSQLLVSIRHLVYIGLSCIATSLVTLSNLVLYLLSLVQLPSYYSIAILVSCFVSYVGYYFLSLSLA